MKNILIIGSSNAIKALFQEKFKGDKIEYISFREAWKTQLEKKYDIIAVSGFHFYVTSIKYEKLNLYIEDYFNYIQKISRLCEKTYLVSTKLKISFSYSRVVFFYFSLLKMIFKNKLDIKVLSFYSMLNPEKDKIKIKIFKILNKEFSDNYFKDILLQELEIKRIDNISFKYVEIRRSRFIDRILRIFDK